ncbi:MAG: hypothetical protein ACO4AJ_02005 [Prochlorothrix sp.]
MKHGLPADRVTAGGDDSSNFLDLLRVAGRRFAQTGDQVPGSPVAGPQGPKIQFFSDPVTHQPPTCYAR